MEMKADEFCQQRAGYFISAAILAILHVTSPKPPPEWKSRKLLAEEPRRKLPLCIVGAAK